MKQNDLFRQSHRSGRPGGYRFLFEERRQIEETKAVQENRHMSSGHYDGARFFELAGQLPAMAGDDFALIESPLLVEALVYFPHATQVMLV